MFDLLFFFFNNDHYLILFILLFNYIILKTLFYYLIIFYLLYLELGFFFRLGVSVQCQVSVRSQYLVRLLSFCWITGGHTIHPPIEGLLSPFGTEATPFQNSASNVVGLQVHAIAPISIPFLTGLPKHYATNAA